MERFFGFVVKEFYHIVRDKRTLLILIGMPIAQILIFGYVITNEINDAKIAILDKSKDEITMKLTSKILGSGYFLLDKYLTDESEIEQAFKEGKIREVIVFEQDFAKNLERTLSADIQVIVDASDANTAHLVAGYTQAIINDFSEDYFKDRQVPMKITAMSRMCYNENLKGAYMYIPGTMALILMIISALMTSVSIAREKETGTMEALLVSPLRPLPIIAGKVLPYVGMAFINVITIIALGYYVFEVPVTGSMILLLVLSILYIILALSLGIFISTVSKKQQTAMFISVFGLLLPTMLLSGFIFPIENMPKILQWFSHIIPAKYYIIIIKNIMIKGTGVAFIWKEALILTGMTLFFIGISVKKFKIRLE
jgi:ABC-2 type transport system permease protein